MSHHWTLPSQEILKIYGLSTNYLMVWFNWTMTSTLSLNSKLPGRLVLMA